MAKTKQRPNGEGTIKLDEAMIIKIASEIEKGMYINSACLLFGIRKSTWYEWIRKAHRSPEQYPLCVKFSDQVNIAMAKCQQYHVGQLHKAAVTESKASMFFLERRFPKEYGKREYTENDPSATESEEIETMSEEEILERIKNNQSAIEKIDNARKRKKK